MVLIVRLPETEPRLLREELEPGLASYSVTASSVALPPPPDCARYRGDVREMKGRY